MQLRSLVTAVVLLCPPAFAASSGCADLKHHAVPAAEIGLPTRGAFVRSASQQTGFCKILGQILSVDPAADPIRFEVNLPDAWNHKAVQFGGGSFDGYLRQSDGLRATILGDHSKPTPLAQGYATFGSDSGHHHHYLLLPDVVNAVNAKFALNDEQRRNFASDSLKKTHDVAVALMRACFGAPPSRMYFVGGSTGGREAMMVVDRWPDDYDGVLAAYAAWNQVQSDLQFIRIAQAMYAPGGWLPGAKTRLLRDAVLNACDAQDGLKDGIVSDPASCHFDPATVRCPGGKDGKACLSDGQEATVAAFSTPQVSDFALANGMREEPGFNVLRGADLVGNMGLLRHPFRPSIPLLNSFYYVVGDGVLRFFLTRDPHFDTLTFNTRTGGPWVAGIQKQSAEDDASLADLTPYQRHGGKLLLVHGVADATIPTDASVLLYHRIVEAMGQPAADSFLRLYLIPGYGHGHGPFDAGFDTVGTLDAWADRGIAPGGLVAADQNRGANRTRPLCAFPSRPIYRAGDPNLAASFRCLSKD